MLSQEVRYLVKSNNKKDSSKTTNIKNNKNNEFVSSLK